MAIDVKELVLGIRFRGWGNFSGVKTFERDGEAVYQYVFEYLGGSSSVEVTQAEFLSPPPEGTAFFIEGKGNYVPYNGTIRLQVEKKTVLRELKPEDFAKGILIHGAGVVVTRKASVVNRKAFMKVTIKFNGGVHLFNDMSPELFQKIPPVGDYVSFIIGLSTITEKRDGSQSQAYVPVLMNASGDTFAPQNDSTVTPESRSTGYTQGSSAPETTASTKARRPE